MNPIFRPATALFAVLAISAHAQPNFDADIQPFLEKHCVRCHNGDKQKGDFRIDTLSRDVGVKDTPQWFEVMEKLSAGEMPPDDEPELPTAEEAAGIVRWLDARIKDGEAARMARRDRVTFHRMSREEYVNTVYDLLGVHFDATDPGGFTDDPDWRGFERIGSVLTLSASHIEKYFNAAETVLAEAYPDKAPEPVEIKKTAVPDSKITGKYRDYLEAKGLLNKCRFEMWPGDVFRYGSPGRLTAPGVYEVKIQLSGLKPPDGRAPRIKVYQESLDRVLFERDIVTPEDKPVVVSFKAHLPAAHQRVMIYNDVPGPSILPRSGRHGRKPFVSIKEGRIPWQLKLTDEEGVPLYPFLIVDWTEWRGPIVTEREKRLRTEHFPAEETPEAARESLAKLAKRAFRRPLREGELAKYEGIANSEMEAGEDFKTAVKAAMLAILCSKSFLFLAEGDDHRDRHQLNDWEIASRLSFMLWSTMPDAELFALAEAGKLSNPAELKKQVARLLDDPRSRRFCRSFPTQWLQLKKVGRFPPDKKLYPDYDQHLEKSMIGETTAFFTQVLENGLTLREFIQSDWTMANPRLARFYNLSGVGAADEFQRVALRPADQRGGLLTQASILSLTSDGTRHRPVHRGVWLSEAIFGKTPPPPPANVDPIEPNPVDSPKATLRMKLEAHMADPNCASCHRTIDPLGLAFDNYDAIGKWRSHEVVQQGTGANPEVDSSGELPDGRKFANAAEFKQLLLADVDAFGEAFLEKLAIYGMRRTMTFEDRDELAEVAAQAKAADYQLRATIEAFVLSDLFRKR